MMFVYYKCYISTELTFLEELILIKQVHQESVAVIVTIDIKVINLMQTVD